VDTKGTVEASDVEAPVNWHRPTPTAQAPTLNDAGRLPLNEVLSDRVGAGSPFGDDVVFPVDPKSLNYYHPQRGSGGHGH
jgi:succinate dehydrogenase / fumarate reductase iron-sulfur subunit